MAKSTPNACSNPLSNPPAGGVLNYAKPVARAAPFHDIVRATLAFGGPAWVIDGVATYFAIVQRKFSADPGEAAAQLSLRTEKFVIATIVTSVALLIVALIVLGVQLLVWRIAPVERPRPSTWFAAGVGIAYCGMTWGAWALGHTVPVLSDGAGQLAVALLAAVAAGLALGYRRRGWAG